MKINEALKDYNYSIEKAIQAFTKLSEDEVKTLVKRMSLGDYAAISTAIGFGDQETNEGEMRRILNDYLYKDEENEQPAKPNSFSFKKEFEESDSFNEVEELEEAFLDFMRKANYQSLYKSDILSKVPLAEQTMHKMFLPKIVREAYDAVDFLRMSDMKRYIKENTNIEISEDLTFSQIKDLAVMKYVFENNILPNNVSNKPMNPKLKSDLARVVRKPVGNIKAPAMTDTKTNTNAPIVSVDAKNQTVATQNDKGEVNIHDLKDQKNKDLVTFESQFKGRLQRLAGIK